METLDYSTRPRTVYLEILYGCNLYCSYCYVGREWNHTRPIVPPFETTLRILEILKRENIEEVVLLGGEPMLHPHFTKLCHTLTTLDFPHRGVITNGTALTLEKAQVLAETGFWVDISFRGPDAATFDAVAGKEGSFQKAFDAALLLSGLGMAIAIEFDCIPENYARLYETIKMLVDAGVRIKQIQLHRILPEGDAAQHMETFSLSLEQWQIVFDQAARVRDQLGIPVIFEDGFPFCLLQPEYWDMLSPCGCGFTQLSINPAGDARHCLCHSEVLGNVLQDSLVLIWKQGLRDYRAPTRHYPACLACDLFEACRGGCSTSSHMKLNEGMDIFREHFRPIGRDGKHKSEIKYILGQSIRTAITLGKLR